MRAVSNDAPKTTINQASIGFQRELARNLVLTVDGVWTKGTNLASLVNLNQPLPNAAGNNALGALPYPNFGFIEWRAQNGESEYKGIDLGLERRFSNGYGFGVSYTLGDSKDNASEQLTTQGSNAFPQNARDFSLVRAERLRRPPPPRRELRGRAALRQGQEVGDLGRGQGPPRRLDALRHLHLALRPALHGQPERQQRRHQHDRPAEPGGRPRPGSTAAATRRPTAPRSCAGSTRPRSRPSPPAPSATSSATSSAAPTGELRPQPAAPDRLRRAGWAPSCAGTSSTSSTGRTSACRTATSPTPPPWARSRSLGGDPRLMQLSLRLLF